MESLKKYTKNQVLQMERGDWEFERSSGYPGERNTNKFSKEFEAWIYEDEYNERLRLKDQYHNEYLTLIKFIEHLKMEAKTDHKQILSFLEDKYFKI